MGNGTGWRGLKGWKDTEKRDGIGVGRRDMGRQQVRSHCYVGDAQQLIYFVTEPNHRYRAYGFSRANVPRSIVLMASLSFTSLYTPLVSTFLSSFALIQLQFYTLNKAIMSSNTL